MEGGEKKPESKRSTTAGLEVCIRGFAATAKKRLTRLQVNPLATPVEHAVGMRQACHANRHFSNVGKQNVR